MENDYPIKMALVPLTQEYFHRNSAEYVGGEIIKYEEQKYLVSALGVSKNHGSPPEQEFHVWIPGFIRPEQFSLERISIYEINPVKEENHEEIKDFLESLGLRENIGLEKIIHFEFERPVILN